MVYKMRKKIISLDYKKIIFIATVCLSLSYFIFTDNMAIGHDTSFHMYRIQGIVNALQDRQFLPKIYPYANNGFGYATPLFYCDVFIYPFAILYYLGVPIVVSYKIMRCFYICFSVFSIFYTTEKIFENQKLAPYIATLLYTYCNYHLYDIYLRDAFGEYLALAFIPIVVFSIYKVLEKHENCWILMGISFSALLCSHLLSFAIVCIVFLCYIIVYCIKNHNNISLLKSRLFVIIKAALLGILLSSFFLAPMLEQMNSQKFMVNYYKDYLNINESAPFKEIIFRPFVNFIDYRSKGTDNCIFNLGYLFYFGQLIYFYILLKGHGKTILTFSFIVSNIGILFSLGFAPTFGIFSAINVLQFAFRFNIISFILLTYVITYSLLKINSKARYLLMAIIVFYSCINMISVYYYDLKMTKRCYNRQSYEEAYSTSALSDSYDNIQLSAGEYLPANDLYQYKDEDASYIKIVLEDRYNYYIACNKINGIDVPIEYKRNGTHIYFTYTSEYETLMMLPLTYYKGYSVYAIDSKGNAKRLGYEDIGRYKQVAFRNKIGTYDYYCYYEGTTIQKVSLYISMFTAIATTVAIAVSKKHKNTKSL